MIRNNLATQPFYNEGAVRVWIAVLAIVLALATLANVTAVVRYSRSDTELATQAARDEERAAELRRTAATLRASVDAKEIAAASVQARQANDLIDRRTLSWTQLLNQFEETLPEEVRITSVRPQQERTGGVVLSLTVVARSVDDVNQFLDNLVDTGAFRDPVSTQDRVNDDGQVEAAIETVYLPKGAAEAPGR
jgi:Tfp pilus assembly protein PilN